ncbi:cytochrome P450 [Hypoxylon sp. FL1150]|nr:cytochrome P450 [Hypoxylon sp. FL1150]
MSSTEYNSSASHGMNDSIFRGQESAPFTIIRTVATSVLLGTLIYFYVNRRRNQQKLELALTKQYHCEPVLPRVLYKWPLALDLLKVNFDAFFSGHTLEALTTYYISIAETARLELWGVTGYITTDPENIETILSTRFDDFGLGARRVASFPLLGEGIFSQDGTPWKRSRDLIRRQFARVQKQTLQVFTPHIYELVMTLNDAATKSEIVDLKPFFFEFTLNTTTELLFGEPHSSLPKEERDVLRDNFDFAAHGVGIRVRLADLAPFYNPPKFKKACRIVRDWATFFADKALKYKEMRNEALVRDQLLHILIAGRDSTAALLSWTFFHLVRNPDILQKLQEEISVVPSDTHVTREQIQRLPFLRCCLNETLRLYPQLALNFRFANKNTVLSRGGGPDGRSPVFIPKYSGVGWSSYHLHRRESLYGSDSRLWRPQRWEDGELIKGVKPGAGFIDFNVGSRLCLGKDFALMEASYAMIHLLQAFPNVRLPPGVLNESVGSERQSFSIVLSPLDGVNVQLV